MPCVCTAVAAAAVVAHLFVFVLVLLFIIIMGFPPSFFSFLLLRSLRPLREKKREEWRNRKNIGK